MRPGPALENDRLRFGGGLIVALVRTTRVPEDGREHPLTAHHGEIVLRSAVAHRNVMPADWVDRGDLFAPAYEGEAFFVAFEGTPPHAVQVEADGVNALSAEPAGTALRADPQNYVVCPPQRWLDGFYDGQRRVRQFTAAIDTIASDRTGRGLMFRVCPLKKIALEKPQAPSIDVLHETDFEWSIRKGGVIGEPIVRDPLGVESWDREAVEDARIHLVDVNWFSRITGEPPPPPPLDPPIYRDRK